LSVLAAPFLAGCLPVPVTTFGGVHGSVVDAIDGHGISGARVRVLSLGCGEGTTQPTESLPVVAETKTGDAGYFYIESRSEWRWVLVFPIGDRAAVLNRLMVDSPGYHFKTVDCYDAENHTDFGRIELHR
jgi:hypothetical protein